jgi:DNA adenine methylase
LNRTCWNALYRVNRAGKFNVPRGTKNSVLLPTDNFAATSQALQHADLKIRDFNDTLSVAGEGDLIFADPPYFSNSKSGTFVKYTGAQFNWSDQMRLAAAVILASRRGAHFVLTNVDVPELSELYAGIGHVIKLKRPSVISGSKAGRGTASELLWTSFPLKL